MYSLTPILKVLFTRCSCILCGRLTHMHTLRHKHTDHTHTYFFVLCVSTEIKRVVNWKTARSLAVSGTLKTGDGTSNQPLSKQ